jgi:hypothetical protein
LDETIETAKNTLDYWETHKEYGINLYLIEVYPGTQLYKYAIRNNIIKDPVKYLKDGCPNVNVSKLSDDDLSYVMTKLLLPSENYIKPVDYKVLSVNEPVPGGFAIKGKCAKCHREGVWESVMAFSDFRSAINCTHCGQVHNIPLPDEVRDIVLDSISKLVKCSEKIGLWGINQHTVPLFNENRMFMDGRFVFMDSYPQKQLIKIQGKKVLSPEEAITDGLDSIVFFYTMCYSNYKDVVKQNYPSIKKFVNVIDLLENRW